MECKVIIDESHYKDLLEISKKYFELKETLKEKKEKCQSWNQESSSEKQSDQIGEGENSQEIDSKEGEKKEDEQTGEGEKLEERANSDLKEIVEHFKTRDRKKAFIILTKLSLLPEFKIFPSREVSIAGSFFPHSNIIKLLKYVFYPHIKGKLLVGKDDFLSFLEKNNFGHFVKKRKEGKRKKSSKEMEGKGKSIEFCDNTFQWYCLA